MKIGHISDLHILDIADVSPLDFANKRLLGAANLILRRSHAHSADVARRAIERLVEADVDHIVITGDLTNLALPSEFEAAAQILADVVDDPDRVSLIPGNHDYYTREAVAARRFETTFAPYLTSDLPEYQTERGYPFCRVRDGVAVVGLNSGIATPWFFATGRVHEDELDAAYDLLQDDALADRFIIVMVHHHLLPFEHSRVEFTRRLINADRVLQVCRQGGVDLVVHGHNHHYDVIEQPKLTGAGTMRICEAGSASVQQYGEPAFGGKYNIYHVEDAQLRSIETHLYQGSEVGFSPWKEQTFHADLDGSDARL